MAIVATILANFVNLWLVQALESKIDTLEINKRPSGGAPRSAHIHLVFQFRFLIMKKLHYGLNQREAALQNKEMDVD